MIFGYVFDDGFTVPAAVSIYSLLYNNKHIDDLNIVIFDDGISGDSKHKITLMVNKFGRTVKFIEVTEIKKKLLEVTSYNWNGSYSVYFKLLPNTLLPDYDGRIIIIDADTIINGKVDYLTCMDLCGKPCAMALEAMPISYYHYSKLGNSELANTGLIVIDTKKWSEMQVDNKVINYLKEIREKNMLPDEDIISVVLKNQFARISPEYNYLTQYYMFASNVFYRYLGWDKLNYKGIFYSLDELKNARDNAVIYHCIDTFTNRPWQKNNIHPYSKLFDRYLEHTPWKNYEKKKRKMSLKLSAELFLRRLLPRSLSYFLYAFAVRYTYGVVAKKFYS